MSQSLPPLLVFSDLDGTLIDHDTYSFAAALPALSALRQINAGVILASSKTSAEVHVLRAQMGLDAWPAIVENGAGVLEPGPLPPTQSAQYAKIRQIIDRAPASLRRHFRGFGDMTITDIVAATGLPDDMAELAKRRGFSEPGLWSGKDAQKSEFIDFINKNGLSARMGGRFLTLSSGRTKADQMGEIITRFRPSHTVALGDAPNDIEMLETADFGFIVANPVAPPIAKLDGEKIGRIRRTELTGPNGWNMAILGILSDLDL